MKTLLMTLLIPLLGIQVFSQSSFSAQIKGRILDKSNNNALFVATVTCLLANDSSKVAIQFTDKNGAFTFDSLPAGNYILSITFIGFELMMRPVTIPSKTMTVDIGSILLNKVGLNLTQFEIKEPRNAVRVANDTIEFGAWHFKTEENSVVESLLRKLPGVQIGNDGIIRINGEIVRTILINGYEILVGNNPKMITKNLQADLIDKIQLIDRKIDQREGSGINEMTSNKVINLTIKKNKQNLLSGELTSAIGSSGRFSTKLSLNRFNEHHQLFVIANGDNINGAMDATSFTGGGENKKWNNGISYNNQITNNLTFEGSYSMNSEQNSLQSTTVRQYMLSDSGFRNNQVVNNNENSSTHSLSMRIGLKIDSLQKITLMSQIVYSNSTNNLKSNYKSATNHSQAINSGSINTLEKNSYVNSYTELQYEKLFKKKGRTLNLSTSYGTNSGKGDKYNQSQNSFMTVNSEVLNDTINQHIINDNSGQQLFFMVNYTEPIRENGSILFSFSEDKILRQSSKNVFLYNYTTLLYDNLNEKLSNNFKYVPNQHFARVAWAYRKRKLEYSLSLSTLLSSIKNSDLNKNENSYTSAYILLPEARLTYKISDNEKFNFLYKKVPRLPQIAQLQPFEDNSDPLVTKIGNPDLKPMEIHILNLAYNYINIKSLTSLNLILSSRFLNKQIVNAIKFDSIGRQVSQPVNLSGGTDNSLSVESFLQSKKRKIFVRFNTTVKYVRALSYLNGEKLMTNESYFSQSIDYDYSNKDVFNFMLSANGSYNNAWYSNHDMQGTKYINGTFTAAGNLKLPLGLTINGNINYAMTTGKPNTYNADVLILNASISKSLFSKKQGVIKIQGFDLLKRNSSINRRIDNNFIEDTKSNVLERFFLLKFSYFLGK